MGELALEKKADDVLVMDLRKLDAITDFFVICSGSVKQHVKAITDHIVQQMARQGIKVYHQEGYGNMRWVLLDYLDVVVHVFQPAWRDYYRLEDLWGDARFRVLDDAYLRRKARLAAKKKRRISKKKVTTPKKPKTSRTKRSRRLRS